MPAGYVNIDRRNDLELQDASTNILVKYFHKSYWIIALGAVVAIIALVISYVKENSQKKERVIYKIGYFDD